MQPRKAQVTKVRAGNEPDGKRQVRKGLGLVGLGIASGAALVVPAVIAPSSAHAATSAPGSAPKYNSTASATAGYVSVAGSQVTRSGTVTATDTSGSQGSSTGIPGGENLGGLGTVEGVSAVSTAADASPSGKSDACSAVASAGCGSSGNAPVTVDLSLSGLAKLVPTGTLPIGSLPGSLNRDTVVVALTGPAAACGAGPSGGPGSDFTASENPGLATVSVVNGKKTLVGPVQVSSGSVTGALSSHGTLGTVLAAIPSDVATITPEDGTTNGAGSGPASAAQAGKLELTVGGTSSLSLVGGSVTCGANQEAASTTTTGSSPVPSASPLPTGSSTGTGTGGLSTGTVAAGGTSSSGTEKPLTSIQTDEGRYQPAADETPLWGGVGGAAAILAAGGTILWRRRASRA